MFGAIVAGRLVQTNIQRVDNNRFVFELPSVETINHIVVFLTGVEPFPEGWGATVHFMYPGKDHWQTLGMLSNSKPSAIFRLRGAAIPSHPSTASLLQPNTASTSPGSATLGILVQELSQVEAQVASLNATSEPSSAEGASSQSQAVVSASRQPTNPEVTSLAFKVAKNFYNFLSSFVPTSNPGGPPVSITPSDLEQALERWYRTFEGKIQNGGLAWLNTQD